MCIRDRPYTVLANNFKFISATSVGAYPALDYIIGEDELGFRRDIRLLSASEGRSSPADVNQ